MEVGAANRIMVKGSCRSVWNFNVIGCMKNNNWKYKVEKTMKGKYSCKIKKVMFLAEGASIV